MLAAAELREAVSRVISDSPDCIVLSQSLPMGDTGEVINSLRGLAGANAAPVVLIAPAEIPPEGPAGFLPDRDRRLTPTVLPEDLLAAVRGGGRREGPGTGARLKGAVLRPAELRDSSRILLTSYLRRHRFFAEEEKAIALPNSA